MIDCSQWTGPGVLEPNIPPSLQQMFTLARRMGYDMRPNARHTETTRQALGSPRMRDRDTEHQSDRDATTRRFSVSAAVIWDTHRLVAQSRIHHFSSDQMAGTRSLMVHDSTLTVPHRETTYRSGPHPHRSTRYSFGPHLIFILRINIYFWIVQLTHRESFYRRKLCAVRGSGCCGIDRFLISSYY